MKERLKEIRSNIGLSQKKFAEDIGVSLSNIESYEMGRRTPSDAFIQLLCTKYHVNEEWLRTGSGEMKSTLSREQEIAEITTRMIKEDNPKRLELQKLFIEMSEENLELLYQTAKKWIDAVEKDQQ